MFGGGQRVVVDLTDEATHAGIPVIIILLGRKTNYFDRFNPHVVAYDGRYNRIGTLLGTARRLRRVLQVEQPAILHTHGWDADIIGWLAIQGTKIRQIAHLHVMLDWLESRKIKHRIRRGLTRATFSRPETRRVAVSEAVRRYWTTYLPCDAGSIQVIRNGIDVEQYRPEEKPQDQNVAMPVIGIAARLGPMKGIESLLEAVATLAREGRVFQLKIAGTGSHREALERRAKDAGVAQRTTFLGHVEDMADFYRSLDIFTLPSLTEGMPLTVLEAMATGIPVIASAIGGIPEAVRDGVDGLLVPPADVGALASALRRLLVDRGLRTRMGESARQRAVEAFSLQRFFGEMMELYRQTLDAETRYTS